jgi:hypothetical protein
MERAQTFLILLRADPESAMINPTIKLLISGLHDVVGRVEVGLAALGAERRCAMRLDRLADRLGAMGARIGTLRERMAGGLNVAIDADGSLRAMLKGLKEDVRGIRCQMGGMRRSGQSARMQRAFARLSAVAEETYASADQLQWEIDEHDGRFAS